MSRDKADKGLTIEERMELIGLLKIRFEKNTDRHKGINWNEVQSRLEANVGKLWLLSQMEQTEGEPGPLGKNENTYRGIFILNVATIDAAQKLLKTDPAIKEGLLDAELYNWYGSAALPEYLKASDKIWKSKP